MEKTRSRQPNDALIVAFFALITYGLISVFTSLPPIIKNEFRVEFFTVPIFIPSLPDYWWLIIVILIIFGVSLISKTLKYLRDLPMSGAITLIGTIVANTLIIVLTTITVKWIGLSFLFVEVVVIYLIFFLFTLKEIVGK